MGYTVNQLYNKVFERAVQVYDVFKGFFGESHVDLHTPMSDTVLKLGINQFLEERGIQVDYHDATFNIEYPVTDTIVCELQSKYVESKATIYVWWPEVTITNENDKSTKIQDLYAKIEVNLDGTIPMENHGFLLNRATYTEVQFCNNYMHSHVEKIPLTDFTSFQKPCLGNGPIRNTILTLKTEYDDTMWMLFCQELDRFVSVESLRGVPYHYLEYLGNNKHRCSDYDGYDLDDADDAAFTSCFDPSHLRNFIQYYLRRGHLSLSYINGKFTCAMPFKDFILDMSNAFIEYFNEYLAAEKGRIVYCFNHHLFRRLSIANNAFYALDSSGNESIEMYKHQYVLTFKGRRVEVSSIRDEGDGSSSVTVINHRVAMFILRNILRTINYRYGNESNHATAGGEHLASAPQRVCYI